MTLIIGMVEASTEEPVRVSSPKCTQKMLNGTLSTKSITNPNHNVNPKPNHIPEI